MSIRALLFDYGGTLDGPASHWLDRFVDYYRASGVELPFARIKSAFYRADEAAYADTAVAEMGLRDLMDYHVAVQLDALAIDDRCLATALAERFVADSQAALAASRRVLADLHRDYRLGVVSNFYGNVGRILDDAGIGALLAVVADSNRLGFAKPDPRIFAHAVTGLGCAPAETLHVGDSYERDVLAARRAGLQAAWLVGEGEVGTSGEVRLRSLDELAALLAGGSALEAP